MEDTMEEKPIAAKKVKYMSEIVTYEICLKHTVGYYFKDTEEDFEPSLKKYSWIE